MAYPYPSLERLASELSEFYDRGHVAGYHQAQREAEAAKHSFAAWCDTIGNAGFLTLCFVVGLWLGKSSEPGPSQTFQKTMTTATADQLMIVRAK